MLMDNYFFPGVAVATAQVSSRYYTTSGWIAAVGYSYATGKIIGFKFLVIRENS